MGIRLTKCRKKTTSGLTWLGEMSINRSDLRVLSYTEFGCLLDALTANVASACAERQLRIDVVAPILRSGGITGCHLASKLGVNAMMPLQYKHTYDPARPICRQFCVPTFTAEPRDSVVVLMADTNTVTGEVARYAARDLRMKWPASTILFASVILDLSIEQWPDVDLLISAQRSNERRSVSQLPEESRGGLTFKWSRRARQSVRSCDRGAAHFEPLAGQRNS
jgi:hypothetical protein